MYLNT